MKYMMLKLLTVFLILLCSHTYAEWTNVICAKPDGSKWYWLKDSNGNQVTASGLWSAAYLRSSSTEYIDAFNIGDETYNKISSQCNNSYVAQPAKSTFSSWAVFQVTKFDGTSYLAPGKFVIYRDRNCFMSPVNCQLQSR
ncbi:hypothetical protein [Spartinivicinus poritis]|uniref:Uncharacterized protein n=1 Tax=Spartinivicinus poritis TaxID=2994640 RepID=A0ABT5U949_9GAMM|nr:hypothetical protein [Spartinivicinus sp. A2-2]MDE1462903.1 hypothetical protein [Spartinivicinus sp. A2-2]